MIKRFFKGKPYSLMLARQDENGDPYTWTVNVTFKSRTQDNDLAFKGTEFSYLVHPDKSVYYTDGYVVTVQILYMDGSFKGRYKNV